MKLKAAITSKTLVPPVKLHLITSSATVIMRKHLLKSLIKKNPSLLMFSSKDTFLFLGYYL